MVTLITFIGLPISIPLGAVSLAGVSVSGVTTALTSKYSVSKVLNNGEIDEKEFSILQALHLKVDNELANIDQKMESENRAQLQKSLQEEINEIKKTLQMR